MLCVKEKTCEIPHVRYLARWSFTKMFTTYIGHVLLSCFIKKKGIIEPTISCFNLR